MSRIVTGLDIGISSIKLIQIRKGRSGLELIKSAYAPIPESPSSDRYKLLTEILKKTLTENRFKNMTNLAICLPRRLAAIKFTILPSQNPAEIKDMIRFEAGKQIPFPIEEAELDYQILRDSPKGGSELIIVAIQNKVINEHLAILRECGLKPLIIELSSMALYNAFNYMGEIDTHEVLLIVDIGSQMTEISIIKNGRMHFTRSAPVSSHGLTSAIQRELGLDLHKAENLKRIHGLDHSGVEAGYQEIYSTVIKNWMSLFHSEIRRSLDAFRAESKEGKVKSVLLSGGGSRLKGLPELLSEHFGVEIKVMEPLKGVMENPGPEWTIALGTALRGLTTNPMEINLLPLSYKMEKWLKRRNAFRLSLVATAGLVLVSAVGVLTTEIRRNWDETDRLKMEIENLGTSASELNKLIQEKNILQEYRWDGPSSLEILLVLSKFSPPDIRLTNFKFRKNEWLYLTGVADSRNSVNNLINIFQKTGWFETVEEKYSQATENKIDFGIECKSGTKK